MRRCREKLHVSRTYSTLSLLAAPLTVTAQSRSTVPRIGILAPGTITQVANTFWEPFLQGLRDLGYVEGQNLAVEYRFAAGQNERLPALAAELARLPVDVLVTAGAGAPAAKQATATTPIVFTVFADPVGEGLVASLARPGGNVTGLSIMVQDLAAKRLELHTSCSRATTGRRHRYSSNMATTSLTPVRSEADLVGLASLHRDHHVA